MPTCNAFKLASNLQNVTFETSSLSLQSVEQFLWSLIVNLNKFSSVKVQRFIVQSSDNV
jgi:hypothetical protein